MRQFVRWKSVISALLHSRRAVFYLLLALVTIAIENEDEILRGIGRGECDSFTLPVRMFYQRFMTVGHSLRAHRVVVVTYSARDIPALAEPCNKRALVAALIRRLGAPDIAPSVIAVDHWYDPNYCNQNPEEQERSKELSDALTEVSTNIPIVLGADSDSWEELGRDPVLPQLMNKGFSRRDLILRPSAFTGLNLSFGLVRLNCDNRRIPLQWCVYPSRDELLKGGTGRGCLRKYSLAYETARLADGRVDQMLQPLIKNDEHPFTGFIPENGFSSLRDGAPIKAPSILCQSGVQGAVAGMADWTNCNPLSLAELKLLRGSVFLLGEDSPTDWHTSVVGKVPGYVLHANYIDALLSDYYFRPLHAGVELALTLFGILLLVTVFELAPSVPWGFVVSTFVLIAIVIVCKLIGLYFKCFLGFWLALVPIPIFEMFYYLRAGSTSGHPGTAESKGASTGKHG